MHFPKLEARKRVLRNFYVFSQYINLIEEVLAFTRNIYQTYTDAPDFLKRHYLRFFYEKLIVKKKKIYSVIPTPVFVELLDQHQILASSYNNEPFAP